MPRPSTLPRPRDEIDADIRRLYGSMPIKTLALQLRITEAQAYRAISRLGIATRTRAQVKGDAIRSAILTLAARPQGMRASDVAQLVPGTTLRKASDRIADLKQARALHSLTLSHRNVRHFSSPEALRAYELRNATRAAAPAPVRVATTRGPAYLPGEPVITDRTKVTIAPAPPARPWRSNTYLMAG